MKKTIVLFISFTILSTSIGFANSYKIFFIYKNYNYYVGIVDSEIIPISSFDPMTIIDQSQTHRLLLNSIEKSKLTSLLYVGDKYEFNNIQLELIYTNTYIIYDKKLNMKITFKLGNFDNIIITTALNFGKQQFDITDKIATALSVKLLLKKMTGKLTIDQQKETDKIIHDSKLQAAYEQFVNELKRLPKKDRLYYLKNFIKLNFQLQAESGLRGDWIHPAHLYFYKKGDYKSFAFFYYYTLKQLDFETRAYLLINLQRKDKQELDKMYHLFRKDIKNRDDYYEIQKLEFQYKYVNSLTNLKTFTDNYKKIDIEKPSQIYFYDPPEIDNAIYLIAIKIKDNWLYTTGEKFIDAGIRKPERSCSHYARNGCYYTFFDKDFAILNNQPFFTRQFTWDIYWE